jgi:hypothetical protein
LLISQAGFRPPSARWRFRQAAAEKGVRGANLFMFASDDRGNASSIQDQVVLRFSPPHLRSRRANRVPHLNVGRPTQIRSPTRSRIQSSPWGVPSASRLESEMPSYPPAQNGQTRPLQLFGAVNASCSVNRFSVQRTVPRWFSWAERAELAVPGTRGNQNACKIARPANRWHQRFGLHVRVGRRDRY